MGQIINKIKEKITNSKRVTLFMLGNCASGRTTMLYKWKLGQIVNTIPTIGFNVEDVQYKNSTFCFWDVGGGDRIRHLFMHYMPTMDGIIVVVDSHTLWAENLLQTTLRDCLEVIYKGKQLPLLILANKKDTCERTDEEILNHVGISAISHKVYYKVIHTNCFSGEGLGESLEWIYQEFVKK